MKKIVDFTFDLFVFFGVRQLLTLQLFSWMSSNLSWTIAAIIAIAFAELFEFSFKGAKK